MRIEGSILLYSTSSPSTWALRGSDRQNSCKGSGWAEMLSATEAAWLPCPCLLFPAVKWNAAWAPWPCLNLATAYFAWLAAAGTPELTWRIYKSGLDGTELLNRDASPSRFLSDGDAQESGKQVRWKYNGERPGCRCRHISAQVTSHLGIDATGDWNMDRDGRDGVSFSLPASASRVRLASRDSCRHRTKERLFVREPSGSELNLAWLSSAPRWTN